MRCKTLAIPEFGCDDWRSSTLEPHQHPLLVLPPLRGWTNSIQKHKTTFEEQNELLQSSISTEHPLRKLLPGTQATKKIEPSQKESREEKAVCWKESGLPGLPLEQNNQSFEQFRWHPVLPHSHKYSFTLNPMSLQVSSARLSIVLSFVFRCVLWHELL